eukprot:s3147_g3.t1
MRRAVRCCDVMRCQFLREVARECFVFHIVNLQFLREFAHKSFVFTTLAFSVFEGSLRRELRFSRLQPSGLLCVAVARLLFGVLGAAASISQQALPDLICQLQSSVGTAGLHPRAPDPSGRCRTSSATARSQWALPDFIRERQIPVGTAGLHPRAPDPSGHCRTSSASARSQWAVDFNRERQIPVGNAGLQPRAPDLSGPCRTSTCIHARKNARQNAR